MEPQTIMIAFSVTLTIGALMLKDKADKHTAYTMATVLAVGAVILEEISKVQG